MDCVWNAGPVNVNLPGARAWPTLPREFYVFFQQVANGVNDTSDLTDIATRLSAVEAAAKKPTGGQVRGGQSVHTTGVLPNFVTVTLVNDAVAPGNGYVYGTDAAGAKGWRTSASMLAHTADTTLAVGADGVATIGLTDAAVTAGGTLKRRAFDVKGRLAAESAATTADLAEGTNLYYTDARAAAAAPSFKNRLINGDLSINQRAFAGGALTAGIYGYDRWKGGTGGCNVSVAGGIITHTSGPHVQVIEAPDLAGKTITVSVEDPSGNVSVNVDGVVGTITAGAGRRGVAVIVPSGSTGNVTLTLTAAGVTYRRVQLEVGTAATVWEARSIAIEQILCARYFEKSYSAGTSPGTATQASDFAVYASGLPLGSYLSGSNVVFKVAKRGVPSVTVYSVATGAAGKVRDLQNSADVSAAPSNIGLNGYFCGAAAAGSATGYNLQWHWVADAEL